MGATDSLDAWRVVNMFSFSSTSTRYQSVRYIQIPGYIYAGASGKQV